MEGGKRRIKGKGVWAQKDSFPMKKKLRIVRSMKITPPTGEEGRRYNGS